MTRRVRGRGGAAPTEEALEQATSRATQAVAHRARIECPRRTVARGPETLRERLAGRPGAPLGLVLKGTELQLKVWEALLRLPDGRVSSYQAIAETAGVPSATRAVGNAIGQNHLAVLIPCHRVLRSTGALGGYRWGLDRKTALLGLEAARQAG